MSPIGNSPLMLGGLTQVAASTRERGRNGNSTNPFNGQAGVSNPFQSSARQILSQIAPFNFSTQA